MGWQTDALLLSGIAIAGVAAVYYVFPQMQKGLGAAATGAAQTIGETVGTAIAAVPSGAVKMLYPVIDPLSVNSIQNKSAWNAGYNLGVWVQAVEASGQDPYHLYHGSTLQALQSIPKAAGDFLKWVTGGYL
jgi:hypothetical protein